MLRLLRQLDVRALAACLAALLLAGFLARGLHAASHAHDDHASERAVCEGQASDPHAHSTSDLDLGGDCLMCALAGQELVEQPVGQRAWLGARAQHAYPAPQAAPRAGPSGLAAARAPPAARA